MADLGVIGKTGQPNRGGSIIVCPSILHIRKIDCSGIRLVPGGRDDVVFNSSGPSYRMEACGKRTIQWPVNAQARTISISVKQAANLSPRPRMIIKANLDVGINSDLESVAGSSAGWTSLSLTFTPTAVGVIQIVLENRQDTQWGSTPCYWDDLAEV